MTTDLISKRTRNAFREFLVGWTLRQIGDEFEAAGISCDREFTPEEKGQRRAFVEQHYHALDFKNPDDVRRLLDVYSSILKNAEQRLSSDYSDDALISAINNLKSLLRDDGYEIDGHRISPATLRLSEAFGREQTISEITRRAIVDFVENMSERWNGKLGEDDFLKRLFYFSDSPSMSKALLSFSATLSRSPVNHDWVNRVFGIAGLKVLELPDDDFLRLISMMAHPVIRPDSKIARNLIRDFNQILKADGWELTEGKPISGKPVFVARKRANHSVVMPAPTSAHDVLTDEYVRELSEKCDSRLASGDLEGAVTVARTFLEAILVELEIRLAGKKGDHKGDLPKLYKAVSKQLRMDEQRPDLDDRFKDVIRGLLMVVNGLAPLRNKMSDGHARERKPAPHHARVVVNAARTISAFLVDSYVAQTDKGLIKKSSEVQP